MGRLVEVVKSVFTTRTTAPGKAVIIHSKASGNVDRTTELYHLPGISSAPTPEDKAIEIPLDGGGRVIVATHNYRLEISVTAGETIIYSTDATGGTKKAEIKLDTDGNIDLNGSSKKLVTHAELNTALQTFITALNANLGTKLDGSGTPGALALNIALSETAKVRTS